MKDFNLSEKRIDLDYPNTESYVYLQSDVKEFIRLLKEDIEIIFKGMNRPHTKDLILYRIDERAGEELNETSSKGCGASLEGGWLTCGEMECGRLRLCEECQGLHKSEEVKHE